MTTEQLLSLNINLKPNKLSDIKELETNHDVRNKLVYFFYQLKKNYDNYQKDLNICSYNGSSIFSKSMDTISP